MSDAYDGRMITAITPFGNGWRFEAACRGLDPDLFFPYTRSGHRTPEMVEKEREALAICEECPVTAECLSNAIQNWDIWSISGGTTPLERKWLAQAVGPKHRFAHEPCGTPAAYRRHLRLGEDACRSCLDAHARAAHGREMAS